MFKKLILTAIGATALCAHATPVYLTFQGNVAFSSTVYGMSTPALGTPETVVVMVDRALPGYFTDQYGVVHVEAPLTPSYPDEYTYFYTQFISGPGITGGSGNPYAPLTYNYSWDYNGSFEGFNIIVSPTDQSSTYNYIQISNPNPGPSYADFAEGQSYFVTGHGQDLTGAGPSWYGTFTLTDTSLYAPGTQPVDFNNGGAGGNDNGSGGSLAAVPEPGSLCLLSVGLIGLAGAARKRRRSPIAS